MKKRIAIPIGLFSVLIALFFVINGGIVSSLRTQFVDGDGSGYFAYLPALFIHHSVDFAPVVEAEKQRKSTDYVGHNYHVIDGVTVNKFTVGTALLQAPFFGMAYLISEVVGLPLDGYNVVFQYSAGLSAVFWLVIGLVFLIRLLHLKQIPLKQAFWSAIIGLFATNLFFYAFVNPSFSHVYSFAIITGFYFYVARFFQLSQGSQKIKQLYIAAFLFGVVMLIRPANALSIFAMPFLAGGFYPFWIKLKPFLTFKYVGVAFILFVVAFSPQLIINILQTGYPLIDGYQNEGFYFFRPHVFDFLISYQKGWLVYTPFMLLLLPAFFLIYRKSKPRFWALMFFVVVILYVFSSWWNWFYGDSFGMRPMVDYYGLFVLVVSEEVFRIKGIRLKRLLPVFVVLVVCLNLFQSYQYAVGILHPDSMNKKAYWHVFLQGGTEYQGVISGGDEYYYGRLHDQAFLSTLNTIDWMPENWYLKEEMVVYSPEVNSLVVEQNDTFIYSPSFKFEIPQSFTEDSMVYIKYGLHFKELSENAAIHAVVVMSITDTAEEHVFYKGFRIKRLPDKIVRQWRSASIGFKLPPLKPEFDQVKLYVWNKDRQNYLLDSLSINFYQYVP